MSIRLDLTRDFFVYHVITLQVIYKTPEMWYKYVILLYVIVGNACGNQLSSPKIIGGRNVSHQYDFPFMASLRVNGKHICGGSIVDYRHVLTAAHCCFDNTGNPFPTRSMSIAAGNLNINTPDVSNLRAVNTVTVHRNYDPDKNFDDIAVLQIFGSFKTWSGTMKPIDLANFVPTVGLLCTVCGWGITKFNTTVISSNLLYVDIPIIGERQCRAYYGSYLTNKMICAGGRGKDSCQGDSGGPLVCSGVLAGIVSFGSDCGVYPGVYTAVAKYKSWIRKYIDNSSSSWITPSGRHVSLLILHTMFVYHLV